jgi:two-component system invasion response regulator UvrY
MIRILIADDHSIVRRGIRQILLDGFPDAEIDEVSDAESIISQINHNRYDVIISDLSMPGRTGLEVLPQIKAIAPQTPVLIISIHSEDHYAIRVLKSGASGYLSKDLAPDELVSAIQKVLQGKRYITSTVAEKLASSLDEKNSQAPHHNLSDREFSVFNMLSSGKSITEIADSLYLSATTVSTYRSRILAKMNFKNNAELTVYAMEHQLFEAR